MFDEPDENAAELAAMDSPTAYVMGRNMFGPGRGAWDEDWKGWWGDDPPYHAPVFVLTHHAREPLTMEGGTTFTFVTDGIESALAQAREVAGDGDIAIAGGAEATREYLSAGSSTSCDCTWCPCCSARASGCWTALRARSSSSRSR
jgi:dihydrofolate reductase